MSLTVSKIVFPEIGGPVHFVRSALKAFKLYPATYIMDTVFTEEKLTDFQGHTKTMIHCSHLERL
jgi:hypothetical protein